MSRRVGWLVGALMALAFGRDSHERARPHASVVCAKVPRVASAVPLVSATPALVGATALRARAAGTFDAPGVVQREGAPMLCTAREAANRAQFLTTALMECPGEIMDEASRWDPDVLMVPGGGILPGGGPGCSTTQRAYSAYRLFERMGRRPAVLLSGRGPRWAARTLDAAELPCAMAMREQGAARARTSAERTRLRAEARVLSRTHRASPTEAELMCAVILRQYADADRPAVLARLVLEPDSRTTAENVALSAPIMARARYQRVMVVSSPALRGGGFVDNHTRRTLSGLRATRRGTSRYRLGGVGCPFLYGGPAWSVFE